MYFVPGICLPANLIEAIKLQRIKIEELEQKIEYVIQALDKLSVGIYGNANMNRNNSGIFNSNTSNDQLCVKSASCRLKN